MVLSSVNFELEYYHRWVYFLMLETGVALLIVYYLLGKRYLFYQLVVSGNLQILVWSEPN